MSFLDRFLKKKKETPKRVPASAFPPASPAKETPGAEDPLPAFLYGKDRDKKTRALRALLLGGEPLASRDADSVRMYFRALLDEADIEKTARDVRSFEKSNARLYNVKEMQENEAYRVKAEARCRNARASLVFLLEDLPAGREELFTAEDSTRLKKIFGREPAESAPVPGVFLDVYVSVPPGVYRTLLRVWGRYGDEKAKQAAALAPLLDTVRDGNPDVRSPRAAEAMEDARAAMDALGMRPEDIPDEVLSYASGFGILVPVNYLYGNGKKEFISANYPRRSYHEEKEFDPEDDRYYTEEVVTVYYGDPDEAGDPPVKEYGPL